MTEMDIFYIFFYFISAATKIHRVSRDISGQQTQVVTREEQTVQHSDGKRYSEKNEIQ